MRPIGRLRWKMPALMLVGTIVIYVDRNVLGVLAPIPKKKSDFTTKQYSMSRRSRSGRSSAFAKDGRWSSPPADLLFIAPAAG